MKSEAAEARTTTINAVRAKLRGSQPSPVRRPRGCRGNSFASRTFGVLMACVFLAGGLLTAFSVPAEAGAFPATVELSKLGRHKGLFVNHSTVFPEFFPTGIFGASVSSAGDFNGDGLNDFVIGTVSGLGVKGISYVVFGKAGDLGHLINVTQLDGSNGFMISGLTDDAEHSRVSTAGDVNADGVDDIVICGQLTGRLVRTGRCHVVFGHRGSFSPILDLSTLDGSNGFVLNARVEDTFFADTVETTLYKEFIEVASAGDVNGDGIKDIIVGIPSTKTDYGFFAGAAHVVFGRSTGFSAALDLWTLDGTNGFVINGADFWAHTGSSVAGIGDVNGDGVDDIAVGAERFLAYTPSSTRGKAYVIYGKTSPFSAALDLTTLNGANGFEINGPSGTTYYFFGHFVNSAGDLNNDGISDFIIGSANETYVVFGNSSGFGTALDLASLNGVNGFVIGTVRASSASGVGDVNGDGIGDILVSHFESGGIEPARSFVIYGHGEAFPAVLAHTDLDGSNGFILNHGKLVNSSDILTSGAGDVNGDGLADFLIALPGLEDGLFPGGLYLVFGRVDGDLDGMSDTWELQQGLDPTLNDSASDVDSDGLSNLGEYNSGTELHNADSDGDGAPDGVDAYPLVVPARTDFNGDGKSDIVLLSAIRYLGFFYGRVVDYFVRGPSQTYTILETKGCCPRSPPMEPPWEEVALDDHSGDNNADVLWRNQITGDTQLWLLGGGSLSIHNLSTVPPNFEIAGTGDFNGDRRADILWRNTSNGVMSVWYMDGHVATANTLGLVPDPWTVGAVADFNGDHRADILWHNSVTGAATIWMMDGTSVTSQGRLGVVPADFKVAAAGDVNGDKRADIVWRNTSTGGVSLWMLDGANFLGASSLGIVDPVLGIEAVGDYDGDGTEDILWFSRGMRVTIWLLRDGKFSSVARLY